METSMFQFFLLLTYHHTHTQHETQSIKALDRVHRVESPFMFILLLHSMMHTLWQNIGRDWNTKNFNDMLNSLQKRISQLTIISLSSSILNFYFFSTLNI